LTAAGAVATMHSMSTTARPNLDALISDHVAGADALPRHEVDGLVDVADGRADAPHVDDSGEAMSLADDVFTELLVDGDQYEGCRTHTDIRYAPSEGVLGKMTPAVFRYYVRRQVELSLESVATAQFNAKWRLMDARMAFKSRPTWRWATPPGGNPEEGKHPEIKRIDEVRRYVIFAFTFVDTAGTVALEYENGRPKTGNTLPTELAEALKNVFHVQQQQAPTAADGAVQAELAELIAATSTPAATVAPAPVAEKVDEVVRQSARSEIDDAMADAELVRRGPGRPRKE
jgi:hypothetical protein